VDILTSRTIIHPSDINRSLAFYGETLNLPVAREFGDGDGRGVVFFAGGGLIEVVGSGGPAPPDTLDGPGPGSGQGRVVLWLQVRSIDAAIGELTRRGVTLARPAVLEPWGLLEAWIDDPDGLRIHLVEVPADHPLRRDQRRPLLSG